jgi:Xanthosine triphosphate pyrophosphatase
MTANLGAMDLLLATRNPNKTREFAQLLGGNFMVRDLTPESNVPEIVESGTTFEENATLKALAVSKIFPNEIVVADDSGLEVEALGGVPGFFRRVTLEKTRMIVAMSKNSCENCRTREIDQPDSIVSLPWPRTASDDNRGGRSSRHDYEVSTWRKRLWLRSDFCAERV